MGRSFANLAFTPLVKEQQRQHGSRAQYERVGQNEGAGDRLGAHERDFITRRDGFYLATVTETGWPYVQFRGGNPGFLRILDERTLGFADLRGNRQYITTGNLQHDDRVALFLMDYAHQARLKILGHAEVHEGDLPATELLKKLRDPDEAAPVERAVLIHIEGFDWNCPQHITPRFTEAEIRDSIEPLRKRVAALEEENARLRAGAAAGTAGTSPTPPAF